MAKKRKYTPSKEVASFRNDPEFYYESYLGVMSNPDIILEKEAGALGIKLYDQIERDSHAGAVLQSKILDLTSREWEITPGSDSPKDKEIAEFVKDVLLDCNFNAARIELWLFALLYGYGVAEPAYRYDKLKKKVVINTIRCKHPRRFQFDIDRNLLLLTPENLFIGEKVKPNKFVVFTYGSTDNPYGKGLGQRLFWPCFFKKNGVNFWSVFLDKFGSPTAIGRYERSATAEEIDNLEDAVDAFSQETGLTLPKDTEMMLLEATRGGTASYEEFVRYMDGQITLTVLGQTATTEGTAGKLGDEEARENVKNAMLKADTTVECSVWNTSLIKPLVDLNYANVKEYPQMWVRVEKDPSLKEQVEIDAILKEKLGLVLNTAYLYEKYDTPAPDIATPLPVADRASEFVEGKPKDIDGLPIDFDGVDAIADMAMMHQDSTKFVESALKQIIPAIKGSWDKDNPDVNKIGEAITNTYPDIDPDSFMNLAEAAMRDAVLIGGIDNDNKE